MGYQKDRELKQFQDLLNASFWGQNGGTNGRNISMFLQERTSQKTRSSSIKGTYFMR